MEPNYGHRSVGGPLGVEQQLSRRKERGGKGVVLEVIRSFRTSVFFSFFVDFAHGEHEEAEVNRKSRTGVNPDIIYKLSKYIRLQIEESSARVK